MRVPDTGTYPAIRATWRFPRVGAEVSGLARLLWHTPIRVEPHIDQLALIGTRYTVSQKIYQNLLTQSGIHCILPDSHDQKWIDRLISSELTQGVTSLQSKEYAPVLIDKLVQKGAQAIALACTELPLWIDHLTEYTCPIPLLNTADLHCKSALELYQARLI